VGVPEPLCKNGTNATTIRSRATELPAFPFRLGMTKNERCLEREIRWVDLSSIFKSEGIEKNNAIIKVTAGRTSKFERSQWKR
jgi:hypothetical protein